MKESDIIGQDNLIMHFKNAVSNKKISHAYIINGEKGSGKKLLASYFAQLLVCEALDEKPCNKCHSCLQANGHNNPDIKWITHEKPNTISVDDVRIQLNNDIVIRPYNSEYKIYIIDECEKMGIAAQNAILKTIEEPPKYAVIIMLTNNIATFLPTIMSRCITINTRPVSNEVVKDYLIKNYNLSSYDADIAAGFSEGNIGRASRLACSEEFIELKENVMMVIKNISDMSIYELLAAAKETSKYKLNINDYLNLFVMWYRDVLLYKATQDANGLVYKNEIKEINKQASKFTYNGIQDILSGIDKCKLRLRANVNFELALQLMFENIRENVK